MIYKIELTGEDLIDILSVLENSGKAALAVKVRDQYYSQRRQGFSNIGISSRSDKKVDSEEINRHLRAIFGEGYRE